MKSKTSRTSSAIRSNAAGFTLMELLITITIIAALAALIFALSSRMISNAHKAVCVENLRGIGSAIQAYAADQSGVLPGPLYGGQRAEVNPAKLASSNRVGKSGVLVNFIANYLEPERDVPAGETYILEHFGCPSLMKHMDSTNSDAPVVYVMTKTVLNISGKYTDVWGYYPRAATSVPMNISSIEPSHLGKTPVMVELDRATGVTNWGGNFAKTPAHGNERMALYFDWSVRGQRLADWGKEGNL
jgi:prepilin-type N-terminal cleavage/methylation domain-containing protein